MGFKFKAPKIRISAPKISTPKISRQALQIAAMATGVGAPLALEQAKEGNLVGAAASTISGPAGGLMDFVQQSLSQKVPTAFDIAGNPPEMPDAKNVAEDVNAQQANELERRRASRTLFAGGGTGLLGRPQTRSAARTLLGA